MSRFRHRGHRFGRGQVHDGRTIRVGALRCGPLLFSSLQCFVNSAHDFLSLGRSCSDCRSRSAKVASVRNASTKSNFSPLLLGAGGGGTVMAPDATLSLRSKSRATASTMLSLIVGF